MRKVLCPICGNVIRFDEADRSLACPVCRSLIKIKIQRVEDNVLEISDVPTEQLFVGDEIITAELDCMPMPVKKPPVVGIKKRQDEKIDQTALRDSAFSEKSNSTALPPLERNDNSIQRLSATQQGLSKVKEDNNSSLNNVESRPANSGIHEGGVGVLREGKNSQPEQMKWVRWEDVECESELIEEESGISASAAARKKTKTPSDFRIIYIPLYALVSLATLIVLLYAPFVEVRAQSGNMSVSGARLIGELFMQDGIFSQGADLYLYFAGALIIGFAAVTAFYLLFAIKSYGEYDKRILNVSNVFAGVLGAITSALVALFVLVALTFDGVNFVFGSVMIAVILQGYTLISNLDKLPKYRDSKRVLLSPKSTRRKSYFLLGVAMFFIWSALLDVVVSLTCDIAYNVLSGLGVSQNVLTVLSSFSLGIFGAMFEALGTDGVSVASSSADYLLYSYINFAAVACTLVLVAVYSRHTGKTAAIFLEEIKPKGSENILLEDEIKEKNLARLLKKSSAIAFIAYATVLTLEVAGYAVLYRGTGKTLLAVFTMLSFVIASAVALYPYSVLAREQYMKAYVEYEEMGADIPPMTKKQRNRIEVITFFSALSVYFIFILLTVL